MLKTLCRHGFFLLYWIGGGPFFLILTPMEMVGEKGE